MRRYLPVYRIFRSGPCAAVFLCSVAATLATAQTPPGAAPPASAASAPARTVRPVVGKAIAAAQESLRAGNGQAALSQLAEAQALPDLTPWERLVLLRMEGPAAYTAGDLPLALHSFEAVLASPLLPDADRRALIELTIKLAVQAKDMTGALRWLKTYFDEGGSDRALRELYPQVLSVAGEHAAAVREAKTLVRSDDAAGRTTPDAVLRALAASAAAIHDDPSYVLALEHLVVTTRRADYWADLVSRVTARKEFADDRLRTDTYRLMKAVGVPLEAEEYIEWAERAFAAGQPEEALKALDAIRDRGLLGQIKNQAGLAKLREQVAKAAAQDRASLADSEKSALASTDGNAAVAVGLALYNSGETERALDLMARGVAKGGLRRPDDALLRYGMVLALAGKATDAQRTFDQVRGSDGSADLARLWTLYLRSKTRK